MKKYTQNVYFSSTVTLSKISRCRMRLLIRNNSSHILFKIKKIITHTQTHSHKIINELSLTKWLM